MKDVVIIGGGIIGLCTAEKLASEGHKVIIIEKERIAQVPAMAMQRVSLFPKSCQWHLLPP